MKQNKKHTGSFRDPSGFLFFEEGHLYRQVNLQYKDNFDLLMKSGLYEKLVNQGLLISHEEVGIEFAYSDSAYKILKPLPIPFISYPHEWSFSHLKDAALATLEIQNIALDYGMTLKDCSAYNIQFFNGDPVFIDTLSFEKYREGEPWVAYRQFCQHFLAPLALMQYSNIHLNQLFRIYIDGIPLDLTSSLLPLRTRLISSLLVHIHIHNKSHKHYADKTIRLRSPKYKITDRAFRGLLDSLYSSIKKRIWITAGTEWGKYYEETNYSSKAQQQKKTIIESYIEKLKPQNIWDLGANNGLFSRIASDKGISTLAFDIDPVAVELNYQECKKKKEKMLLPLLMDLTNPSPGIGWQNEERMSFMSRGPADMVMALAIIHHLAISNNVPLKGIAEFFSKICGTLIIEFVPKSDSQVMRLLATRVDIFPNYTQQEFENDFSEYFSIRDFQAINESERTLYLMQKKFL